MTADLIIGIARGFVGTKENPAGSNNVIFNTHYYGREVSGSGYPWCAAFIWDIFRLAGASSLYYGGAKTAGCTTLMNWAKANGVFYKDGFRRGDIVLYTWQGNAHLAEHAGILIEDSDGVTVRAVEGNTSLGDDSNGGEVMERERGVRYVIGVMRPQYEGGNVTEDEIKRYLQGGGRAVVDEIIRAYISTDGTGDTHGAWSAEAIEFVKKNGIMQGDSDGDFGWQKPISREAAAQLVYNILGKKE